MRNSVICEPSTAEGVDKSNLPSGICVITQPYTLNWEGETVARKYDVKNRFLRG